ncbi:hypothetical protein [Demequina litorisediminis]|uniref:Uncharacterized protein n=1 Tax=Demequina litorisediminis TaxID=1849022 RepID=A0ABQ6IA70_9MICO|nr:hypothetical protein [Demequina litorisediminis]GMA34534.1 hypothetical protein GCM10025876_07380 [Demequina litorisediminis]
MPTATIRHLPRRWASAAAALVTALLLATLVVPVPAQAAGSGLRLTIDVNGHVYDGTTVVEPGSTYAARLQYSVSEALAGQQFTITVPDGIDVPAGALQVPAGNTVVESLALDGDGNVVVTFKDPLDLSIDQGVLRFDFTFDAPTQGTGIREFTWSVDGEPTSIRVIVRDPSDQLRPELGHEASKTRESVNLGQYVTRTSSGDVSVAAAIADQAIPYTVTFQSADARTGISLTDTVAEYLAVDTDSFTATLTTWDADGFNRTVTPFTLPSATVAGQTVTLADIDLPEHSILTVKYNASVRADKIADLEDALQVLADGVSTVSGGRLLPADGQQRHH